MFRLNARVPAARQRIARTIGCNANICKAPCRSEAGGQRRLHITPCSNDSRALATCLVSPVRPITPQPKQLNKQTGYIENEAGSDQIPSDWNSLLSGVVAAYQQVCGPRLVGVYLRGSLPRGCFIEGISDVDTFALVLQDDDIHSSLPVTGGSDGDSAVGAWGGSRIPTFVELQQQHIKELISSLSVKHAELSFTKIEARILAVPADCPAFAVLQEHVAAQAPCTAYATGRPVGNTPDPSNNSNSNGTSSKPDRTASKNNNGNSSFNSSRLPSISPSMLASIPAAFELKTQSVVLAGVDLPLALPAAAALPPAVQLLPGLSEDIAAARHEAAAADLRGNVQRQVIVAKWSLKRLMRCAFELVQPQAAVWTRDLFWCCHYAGQHLPQLHQQLQKALELYVLLQQQQQQSQLGKAQQQKSQVQQQLTAAWTVIEALLPQVETLFLKQMLAEEPGWLTHHLAQPLPAAANSDCDNNTTAATVPQWQQWLQCPWSIINALQASATAVHTRVQTSPAAAAVSGRIRPSISPQQRVLGSCPPAVQIPVRGSVAAAHWNVADEQAATCRHIRAVLMTRAPKQPDQVQWCNTQAAGDKLQQQQHAELSDCHPQPLLLQGLASDWPAVSGPEPWDLNWLSRQEFSGRVRAAPSLQFPFVEPQLLELLQQIAGPAAAPSCQFTMSCSEFMARLQPDCQLPRLLYEPHEYYYMQADICASLQQQLRLSEFLHMVEQAGAQSRPVSIDEEAISRTAVDSSRYGNATQQRASQDDHNCCVNSKDDGSNTCHTAVAPQPILQFSQAPRIWISPAGAVSPLHYDTSHSFLVQISGYKRMLFFTPDQLYRLYCYPDTHLLRRRSRVNVCSPDFNRFPLFQDAGAVEVILGPGDGVFFPSMWAHYTETLGEHVDCGVASGCSISVTFRLQAA